MTELDDAELVARSRRRDAQAFGALVERHQQLVFGVALARCRDVGLAEDVAQEAFVTAWRDLARLREGDRVGTWVAGIARNLAASATRTRSRQQRILEGEPLVDDVATTPEEQTIEREDRELLARALADVPETHREVLVLHYLQGESVASIAAELGIREALVKQRLSRGRKALRASVAERVETVLGHMRARPALRAGVLAAVAALGHEGTAAAGANLGGKVMIGMTAKQIGMAVGAIAIAGGVVLVATSRDSGAVSRTEAVAAAPTTSAELPSGPPPTLHVRKLAPAAKASLLAAIRAEYGKRTTAVASTGASSASTPAPALPADGDLDKEYIRTAVRELLPMVAECYEEGLERDPMLSGSVIVDFTIEGEPGVGGVVGESAVDGTASTARSAGSRVHPGDDPLAADRSAGLRRDRARALSVRVPSRSTVRRDAAGNRCSQRRALPVRLRVVRRVPGARATGDLAELLLGQRLELLPVERRTLHGRLRLLHSHHLSTPHARSSPSKYIDLATRSRCSSCTAARSIMQSLHAWRSACEQPILHVVRHPTPCAREDVCDVVLSPRE